MARTPKSPERFLAAAGTCRRDKADQRDPGGGLLAIALLMVIALSVV